MSSNILGLLTQYTTKGTQCGEVDLLHSETENTIFILVTGLRIQKGGEKRIPFPTMLRFTSPVENCEVSFGAVFLEKGDTA